MYHADLIPLSAGLYLVATPIGTAKDITLRALDILNSADVIAAEDTRTARKLMDIHGIATRGRRMIAYHDHNGAKARPELMRLIADGKSVAYVSEAGTPLIADPGFDLVRELRSENLPVIAAPGPSAVITALSIAGLPTDTFTFAGFAPNTGAARKKFLKKFAEAQGTLIFYESPKRLFNLLRDMLDIYGPDRRAAICRELTKKFEETISGSLQELHDTLAERTLKGEIVVLVDRPHGHATGADPSAELRLALATMKTREAAAHVAEKLSMPRRMLYQMALEIAQEDTDG